MSDTSTADRASGDFERYGLLAAMTLVVLCLLLADRIRSVSHPAATVPADRLLRVRIGGTRPGAVPAGGTRAAATNPAAVPGGSSRAASARPRVDAAPRPKPAVAVDRACVVGEGETLGDIALRELGTSKRAREIADLNGLTNVHRVRTGQTLRLPAR